MEIMEVLEISVDVLRGIQIPVELAEQVGKPVLGVIGNLRLCMDAIAKGAAETGNTDEQEGEKHE